MQRPELKDHEEKLEEILPSLKLKSRSLGPGRIAGREPRPVKLRISLFRRQDKRKERYGGLKN